MPLAVVVPAAPALLPSVSGATPELAPVRAAALDAVRRLVAAGPERIVVVADAAGEWDESAVLDLGPWGVSSQDVDDLVRGPSLPREHVPAAWLLDECGWTGPRFHGGVAGTELDAHDGVIVVADGTACRTERAPGHLDERAEGVDDRFGRALAAGDLAVLDDLDPALVAALMIAGVPALGWLRRATGGSPVEAELTWSGAPLGVGLWVATWSWVAT